MRTFLANCIPYPCPFLVVGLCLVRTGKEIGGKSHSVGNVTGAARFCGVRGREQLNCPSYVRYHDSVRYPYIPTDEIKPTRGRVRLEVLVFHTPLNQSAVPSTAGCTKIQFQCLYNDSRQQALISALSGSGRQIVASGLYLQGPRKRWDVPYRLHWPVDTKPRRSTEADMTNDSHLACTFKVYPSGRVYHIESTGLLIYSRKKTYLT